MAEPPPLQPPPGVTQPPLAMTTVNQQQLQGLHPPLAQTSINVSNSQHQTALVQQQTRVVPTSVVASSAGHHVLTTSASGHHVLATINQVCKLFPYFIANRNHSIPGELRIEFI